MFKKLEFDLYLKNQKLNSILNEMNEVVWSMNLKNTKLQFITPNVTELYGTSINYFEKNFKNWENFVIDEDKHIVDKINNDIKYIGYFNEKYRIIDTKGNKKYIRHQGRIIYDLNKKPDRIDGIIIDRTQQGLAEQKLQYEENFRNLLLNIASKFIGIKLDQIPELIQDSLQKMSELIGADRGYVFEYNLFNLTNEFKPSKLFSSTDLVYSIFLELKQKSTSPNLPGFRFQVWSLSITISGTKLVECCVLGLPSGLIM